MIGKHLESNLCFGAYSDEVCVARHVFDSMTLYLTKQLLYKMVGTDLLQNRLSISLMHKNNPKRKLNIWQNSDRFKE